MHFAEGADEGQTRGSTRLKDGFVVFADDDESMLLALDAVGDSEDDGREGLAETTSCLPLQPSHLSLALVSAYVTFSRRGRGEVDYVEMCECGNERVPQGSAHLTRDSHACKSTYWSPCAREVDHQLKMQVTNFAPDGISVRCTGQFPFPPELIEVQDTGCKR